MDLWWCLIPKVIRSHAVVNSSGGHIEAVKVSLRYVNGSVFGALEPGEASGRRVGSAGAGQIHPAARWHQVWGTDGHWGVLGPVWGKYERQAEVRDDPCIRPWEGRRRDLHETLRWTFASDVLLSFPSFTEYVETHLMESPSCSYVRSRIIWILVVKIRFAFCCVFSEADGRFHVSLGGERGQGVGAEQVTLTSWFSFSSPEISILGLGGESGSKRNRFSTETQKISPHLTRVQQSKFDSR